MGINVIFNQFDYEISERKKEVWDKYNKLIQWGRQHPLRFAERVLGLQFTDHQKYIFMASWTARFITWVMGRNSGKALSLDTPVYYAPTDRGEKYSQKTIGDLKVGDMIYDAEGKLTEVLHLNPIIIEDCYEIEFEDGDKIICNGEHLWSVYDTIKYKREGKKLYTYNTEYINNCLIKNKENLEDEYRFKIPCNKPLQYPLNNDIELNPYLLGYWLAEGTIGVTNIKVRKKYKEEFLKILDTENIKYSIRTPSLNNAFEIEIKKIKELQKAIEYSFEEKLKKYDVLFNKRIPKDYFYLSIEQRLNLLQGFCDANGSCNENGTIEILQMESRLDLLKDFSKLLTSLGIKHSINLQTPCCTNNENNVYRLSFKTDKTLPCFRYKKKLEQLPNKCSFSMTCKAITNITKLNKKIPMRCITVSNDSGLFLCGEKATVTHNSFLSAPYIMTRSLLIPNHHSYIMSVTGNQAQETFSKMEDLALGNIASIAGTTRVFLGEVVKQNARDSGFTHDKNSYSTTLFNGSDVHTLNSVPKNIVGIRSNLNLYDEAGKIDKDFFALTKPFTTQNTNFITGPNINSKCYPLQFPTQNILCSSAEDIFTELWDSYKQGAMEMMMGNPDYFVCDINADFSLHPKMNGEPYTPLLTQEVIDDAMAKNAFRANREYYNKFDVTGGQDSVVSKAKLIKCSQAYLPVFKWEEGKQYIIINDPSSKIDNSFVLVAEIFKDETKGWMAKVVNGHNLIEITTTGQKKLMQKPEQIGIIQKYLVDYNGPANDYDNIERIIIDAGAGGGGYDMYQFILPGFVINKERHVGVIDYEDKYCQEERAKFPEAKNILTLANFKRDKINMYEATMDALNQELIIFPKDATGNGEMEFEEENEGAVVFRYEKLNSEQLRAVTEIELLKYELMAMEKTKNSSNNSIRFDLMDAKKREGLHDDRADCMAMLCHYLMKKRAADKMKQYNKAKPDLTKLMEGRAQLKQGRFGTGSNPFANRGTNPFL